MALLYSNLFTTTKLVYDNIPATTLRRIPGEEVAIPLRTLLLRDEMLYSSDDIIEGGENYKKTSIIANLLGRFQNTRMIIRQKRFKRSQAPIELQFNADRSPSLTAANELLSAPCR